MPIVSPAANTSGLYFCLLLGKLYGKPTFRLSEDHTLLIDALCNIIPKWIKNPVAKTGGGMEAATRMYVVWIRIWRITAARVCARGVIRELH